MYGTMAAARNFTIFSSFMGRIEKFSGKKKEKHYAYINNFLLYFSAYPFRKNPQINS